jgi:hypothetical protein
MDRSYSMLNVKTDHLLSINIYFIKNGFDAELESDKQKF